MGPRLCLKRVTEYTAFPSPILRPPNLRPAKFRIDLIDRLIQPPLAIRRGVGEKVELALRFAQAGGAYADQADGFELRRRPAVELLAGGVPDDRRGVR